MRNTLRFLLAMMAVGTVLTGPLAASTKHGSTPKEIAGAGNPLSGWPTWSGPHSDLTAAGDGIFDRPGFGLEVLWSKPLGSGYSGIVVAGERVVTAFSDGESDLVAALDAATGDELWRYRIAETYKGHDNSDDGPLATPTIHDGLVYGLGARGRLFALRLADGKQVWSRRLVEELGARKPRYGFVSAPTIVGGVLVIQTGGPEGQSITVLDPKTGKLLWSAGDDAVDYQSPMALRVDGEAQIFALTNRHL
ncbi:MAG: PQQ-binding-like beta-propeller repeat protein, partial [bacterium]|nr:PQQ-binding-like beta-propeller repeat protein [bacterium]